MTNATDMSVPGSQWSLTRTFPGSNTPFSSSDAELDGSNNHFGVEHDERYDLLVRQPSQLRRDVGLDAR